MNVNVFISVGAKHDNEMEVLIMVTGMRGNGMAMEKQKLTSMPKSTQDVQMEIFQISIVTICTIPKISHIVKKKPGYYG